MAEQITWAGRTLSGTDRFGKWVTLNDKFDGWWDSPEPKGETVDRTNADGEHDLPIYNEARLVTIGGHFHAENHAKLHDAMDFFTGAMVGRFQVAGHGVPTWADMKRNSGVKFTPVTDTFAQWQVRLKAVDPRKFGEKRAFDVAPGTPAKAFHRGNYNATPVVQVNGPLTGGFTITHPQGQYVVLGDLGAGSWIRVDMNTGRLKLNGNDRSDLVTRADVCTVLPGSSATFTLSNGSGYVEVLDTYI